MKPFQNLGKEQKLLSTKARLVVLVVVVQGDWSTGSPHSLFESPVFVMS